MGIPIRKIQCILVMVNGKNTLLSLDSGCEGDCIREEECLRLQIPITPLDHTDMVPTQADGNYNLNVVGKAKFTSQRDSFSLDFEG